MARTRSSRSKPDQAAKAYDHQQQPAVLRPDIGLQPRFKKKKEPAVHRRHRVLDLQLSSWDIHAVALEQSLAPKAPEDRRTPKASPEPGRSAQRASVLDCGSPLPLFFRRGPEPRSPLLYIDLAERPSADSREIAPGVVLDFDAEGRLVGIDVDHASQVLDLTRLQAESLPLQSVDVAHG